MAKQPKYMMNLKRWEYPSNYSGENYSDYYTSVGESRDSDISEQSNFASVLEALGGETETVIVARAGHWAVGWVQSILVHKSDKKALKKLSEIMKKLDSYPLLDESDFSEREWKKISDYADGAKIDLAKALKLHFALPRNTSNKLLQGLAYELNIENQCHNGDDSCVNIYPFRKPDIRDLKELKRDLTNVGCNNESLDNLTIKILSHKSFKGLKT